MRKPLRQRLKYLGSAAALFTTGTQVLPDSLQGNGDLWLVGLFAGLYFFLLPLLYWQWVIRGLEEKAWKILIAFGLSAAMARFSFPQDFSQYFDFVMWVRYPLIAGLLLIEFYIMGVVIRALWQARHLKGDPRLHVLDQYAEDDKKRELAAIMAHEPASWFYTLPNLSRNHPKSIANLNLLSGQAWHLAMVLTGLTAVTMAAFYLLLDVSETAAWLTSALIGYGVIMFIANYRISRHFSCYVNDGHLVINNTFFGYCRLPMSAIDTIESGRWSKSDNKEGLFLGRGEQANIKIQLNTYQQYFGLMGQVPENIDTLYLVVDDPEPVVSFMKSSHSEAA